MAATADAHETLRERARRALMDNPEPDPGPDPGPGPAVAADLPANTGYIEERLAAIAMVRELEPRRACYAERVRELSRSLTNLPEHSVHFRTVLDRLREAHSEWQGLEERLQAAQYVIRSTQWLVDLLADPYIGSREVAGGEGQ